MQNHLDEIEEIVTDSGAWETFLDFLRTVLYVNEDKTIKITIGLVLLVFVIYIITTIVLNFLRRIFSRRLPKADKAKFNTVFSFARWLVYIIVLLIVFDSVGVNVTAIFAASAALLIGVGLALQTLFQDIISGVFILIDQSLHVGDIIEIEGKIGRVEEIKLRTTRAVTIDNKVLVIPNHLYLTNSLYNWTQNDTSTRESVSVGVAYGSDVQLVKKLLLEAANKHPEVLSQPEPVVLFTDFGDSSLNFKLIFTLNDSFKAQFPSSDIRFEIDRLFRENNVSIPFPQRDIHIIEKKN
ncbi:MAG: mechanosensitive ion channel protein MscS [Xanthomarina sp.]|uniref:Mechanosensitive ion channel protein MscS n=1 Tax=Xanthomarina gelatinilytica TaxID=1137281 RepID=A0A3D6BW88_9FLAO|nr:mechanosensitive ion channel domain-containing protein [Xanthomarina sp.]MBF62337.1 mechanosensitive ion channel protein MscS [Xanthomarina sp.]MDX1316965.1 mechanosensitive ion channel [Xanthomarina gelatinilytica]HCY83493.1 mechanosensitive ion channel protein MscS [Xanthomarina gelatinilytica]|tara:strand:+ start:550 stop:1437 length:888 start_codon:yes stop_codon:yes gene_type:complete